ncbi:MAG: pilus assembly protein [Pseudomonadota bacterium]
MTRAGMERVRAFLSNEDGNATLEFVVIFPFITYLVFTLAEVGTLMARTVMLDRGLDIAMRDIRLGLTADPTVADIRREICTAAFLLNECEETVLLELVPIVDVNSFPTTPIQCIDRTEEIEPTTTFDPGVRSQIMYVRACIVVDPLFPGAGIGALLPSEADGGYAILARSAFVNEP